MGFPLAKRHWPLLAVLLLTATVAGGFLLAHQSLQKPVDFHQTGYTGSQPCRECHEDRYQSWAKTYHRRMTQEATPETVLGDFNGRKYSYWGYTVRPVRKGDRYYFEYYDKSGQTLLNTLEVSRTVGSRRYQQYLAQTPYTDGNYYRLEMLWHVGDQRWVHMNGVFLGSDNQPFDNHTALWNQNCIFCHNTGVQPGMNNYEQLVDNVKHGQPLNLRQNARYASHVAELGIACESCHAGGEAHVAAERLNPLRKYWQALTDSSDRSIVNPARLSKERSVEICGQCHGQRTPKTLDQARHWVEKGPTFRPGDPLGDHVNPVWQHSTIQGKPSDIFASRFWPDGTPRLTAYEYQGLLQSACYQQGELTCISCHAMHGGDPKGMLEEKQRDNQACAQCHAELVNAVSEHSGHEAGSEGALCYNCHMPERVYGIMTYHRDHHISNPQPAQEFAQGKPNACINCHQDKTDDWVLEKTRTLWPDAAASPSDYRTTGRLPSVVKLHSGDPVERGLAAWNMSRHEETLPFTRRHFLIPHLLLALQDNYPAIRRFAHQSLSRIAAALQAEDPDFARLQHILAPFDFIADANRRQPVVEAALDWYGQVDKSHWPVPPEGSFLDSNYRLNLNAINALRREAQTDSKRIDIGE